MVIYMGRCIESAARDELLGRPLHPYSRTLLAAAAGPLDGQPAAVGAAGARPPPPSAGPRTAGPRDAGPRTADGGPAHSAFGCAYRDRCGYAIAACETLEPPLAEVSPGHFSACHRSREFCVAGQVP
jgi:ABC-type dipeptide/oligopeptide/nickel transport system ATPase component